MVREWKPNWWEQGNCRDIPDPDIFIRPRTVRSVKGNSDNLVDPWVDARKVCDGCPVQLQCLEFVLEEEVRVTGHDSKAFAAGLTPTELRQLRHQRMRKRGRL